MAQDHSFDIVSKVSLQEVHNALQQAQKEISTRFDFKGSSASILLEGDPPVFKLKADHTGQLKSIIDLVQTKMAKRSVSLKAFDWKEPEQLPSGGVKQQAHLIQGLSSEKAKEIVKAIKELPIKVQSRIEAESVRVVARQIDDLQSVMQMLKGKDFGIPIQFENYR